MKISKLNKYVLFITFILFFVFSPILSVVIAADQTSESIVPDIGLITVPIIGVPLIIAHEAAKYIDIKGTVDFVSDPVNSISRGIIVAATTISGSLISYLMGVGKGVLETAIDKSTGVGYTPNDNPYIAIGWGIVRNIANATLVIGLVIIAISIILGIQENQAKKVLLTFILIALLINFTPVICGFIIDGSNIITRSLIIGGIEDVSAIFESMTKTFIDMNADVVEKLSFVITVSLFGIIATVVYFLYALLFIARSMILWILVIISPIAFATKVFPQSKYIKKIFPSVTYWDEWWESFIQWCVIGIPAAMSIFIANKILATTINNISAINEETFIGILFGLSVPFIFLIAGFMITISSGGQVGSFVGGLATGLWAGTAGRAITGATKPLKEKWETVGNTAEGVGKYATGTIAGGTGGMMSSMMEEGAKKDATMASVLSATAKGTIGGAFTRRGQEEGANYWKRAATEAAVDTHMASPDALFKHDSAVRKQAEEQVKDMDFDDIKQFSTYAPRLSQQAQAVAIEKYMEKGPDILTKASAPEREKMVGLIKQFGSKTTQKNALMALAGSGDNDQLAKNLGFDMAEVKTKHGSANELIINKFNSKDTAKYISTDFMNNPDNLAKMNSNHFSYIAQEKGRQGVTIVEQHINWDQLNDRNKKWFSDQKGAASVYAITDQNRYVAPAPTPAPAPQIQQGGAPGTSQQQGGAPGRP